ncbi:MAG TPA: hypothetical protein VHE11_05360 [Steroidobacteraceae bacterium]|nr:hypothetical protein [Steroidobacteraceae bacterium]
MSGDIAGAGLRDRLSRSAEEALQSLDKVLAEPTPARIAALRQALDELMRAAARVRLEVESGANGDRDRSDSPPPPSPVATAGVIALPAKKLD